MVVAGSVGPTGEIMAPMGALTHALAVEIFHEQAEGLKEGGADVLWLETISAAEEYAAAAEAFGLAGMPWCGTMSFDTAGRTMMGLTSADMAAMVEKLPNPAAGLRRQLRRRGLGSVRTVLGFVAQGTERPIIAKGNAGIPKYVDGHIHYDGTPDLMADYAVLARDAGATIIGGCCGTMPDIWAGCALRWKTAPPVRGRRWSRSPRRSARSRRMPASELDDQRMRMVPPPEPHAHSGGAGDHHRPVGPVAGPAAIMLPAPKMVQARLPPSPSVAHAPARRRPARRGVAR